MAKRGDDGSGQDDTAMHGEPWARVEFFVMRRLEENQKRLDDLHDAIEAAKTEADGAHHRIDIRDARIAVWASIFGLAAGVAGTILARWIIK